MEYLINACLTQKKISNEIENSIKDNSLARSVLFSGPQGSSRLTAAFDLSFFITDEMEKRERLESAGIIYLPNRNLESQFKAAMNMFVSMRTRSSQVFLLQTLRTILMQYHPALIDAYSNTVQSLFTQSSDVASVISEYGLDKNKDFETKEITSIEKELRRLVTQQFITKGRKNPNLTIDEVRSIKAWFSLKGENRVVILENVEASTENAKNSILKLLEEPGDNSYIILISTNGRKLLDTILSRLRKFTFPPLNTNQVTNLVTRRFNITGEYDSIDSFFFTMGASAEDKERIRNAVTLFSSSLLAERETPEQEKEEIISTIESLNASRYFREEVAKTLLGALENNTSSVRRIKKAMTTLNTWAQKEDNFNISIRQSIDAMLRERM